MDAHLTLADLRHDHLGLSHRTRTRGVWAHPGQRLCVTGGAITAGAVDLPG
jgi:hypothetical protein